jgi:hypothetical protein
VAIDQGREETTIDESRDGHVVGGRGEMGDYGFTVDMAFQLMAGWILASASETMSEIFGIEILNGCHMSTECITHPAPFS